MGGVHHQGIDYTTLYGHPKFARLNHEEQDALLAQIQHIETGALDTLNEQHRMADQETKQQQQLAQAIEARVELVYQFEHQQRLKAMELTNVRRLPGEDGAFVA
jgi:hypothetical protein